MNPVKPFFLVCFATICTLFASCTSCTKTKDVQCFAGNVIIYGVGFTATDFDSTIAVRYKQDNVFDSVIDTVQLIYSAAEEDTSYFNMADTAFQRLQYLKYGTTYSVPEANGFVAGYDYKIIFPVINKTYVVTGVTQSGIANHTFTYTQGVGVYGSKVPICWNNVVSCKINDTVYTFPSDYTKGSSFVYLQK